MKNIKNFIKTMGITTVVLLSTNMVAFASTYDRPVQIVSNLTGKSVEEIYNEKIEQNKTYGQIVKDAGLLEEFKTANLETKISKINEKVSQGVLTQEEADKIIEKIKARIKECDGTGVNKENSLESKISKINEKVSQGVLTQEEANKIIEKIKSKMKECDGTGLNKENSLESKISKINEKVSQGALTQEEADKTIEKIKSKMKECDGTGLNKETCGKSGINVKKNCDLKDKAQGKKNGMVKGKGQIKGKGLGIVKGYSK